MIPDSTGCAVWEGAGMVNKYLVLIEENTKRAIAMNYIRKAKVIAHRFGR